MSLEGRISALYRVIDGLRLNRDEIINTLMWEICKNNDAATSEFDRTMDYIDNTIVALRESDRREGEFRTVSGITAKFRRNAIGVMMLLGPFNYPVTFTIIFDDKLYC
jgi:glyceraldehyde-3-phosphate dehydrogenase (NADP+)